MPTNFLPEMLTKSPAPWEMGELQLSSTAKSGSWNGWTLPARPQKGTHGIKSINSVLAFNIHPDSLIQQTRGDLEDSPLSPDSGGGQVVHAQEMSKVV